MDVSKPSVPACPLPIADPPLSEANHPATIGIDAIAEVEVLYLYLMLVSHDSSNDVLVLAEKAKQSGDRNMPLGPYTSVMTDKDTVLEEAMEYLKEAGQRISATQSLIRSQGKLDDADYRELDLRLSTSLALVEAAYMEARRRG